MAISTGILIAEVAGAAVSGSLALLADAGHMLTDVAGLCMGLLAVVLGARPATNSRTWGFRRAEILAAAAQSVVLLVVGLVVLVEATLRFISPPAVASGAMVVFGALALVGNLVSILVLSRAQQGGGLNARAALLEVVNDALGAAAVLVAALVIALTGWRRADATASVLIAVLILPRTWRLLRETLDVLLETAPPDVELSEVRAHLLELPHVRAVHDLHASRISTDLRVLTAHVVVDADCFVHGDLPGLLAAAQACLAGHFDVDHSTFQFEPAGHHAGEGSTHSCDPTDGGPTFESHLGRPGH